MFDLAGIDVNAISPRVVQVERGRDQKQDPGVYVTR
jgi:hypothetical protein